MSKKAVSDKHLSLSIVHQRSVVGQNESSTLSLAILQFNQMKTILSNIMKAISMEKDKPRVDVLLPLVKSTFYVRRQYILNSEDSVLSKLEKFPALKLPPLVC